MKLKEKIKNELGNNNVEKLVKTIQRTTNQVIDYNYKCPKQMKKNIISIVVFYIMNYYDKNNIEDITYEELLKNINLILSMIIIQPIYGLIDKKYNDVLWWIIYQLFLNGNIVLTEKSSKIVLRIDDAINCVEAGEYPESYLDSFCSIELEECINQLYLILMSNYFNYDNANI